MAEDNNLIERQRLYERTRDEQIANARSVSESLDRSLLTLSSAFLGGSLAFVGQVVELGSALGIWMLYSAWFLFALTIALTISLFSMGLVSIRRCTMLLGVSIWRANRKLGKSVKESSA